MKALLFLASLFLSMAVFGQKKTLHVKKANDTGVEANYQKELKITKEKAEQLNYILKDIQQQMRKVGVMKHLDANQKRMEFTRIAQLREQRLNQLLSSEEKQRLTNFLNNEKERYKVTH